MPTYQYACTNPECGNRFELVQSFTDPAASTCPVCGKSVRKVYGSVGVVFKGSGFYRTDSRAAASAAEASASSASSKAESKADAKSDSKSESKPAAEKKSEPAAAGSGSGASNKAAATA
ncbi:MAG TPA: FmdB family zinc ribbon protein [Jatrophihabitantaceae bacterium]|nr:FmdB family zinc ribbon protein [Jatrophihabitantaceae bacterium]